MPIRVKRVYEAPAAADGKRVLIDRLWPRGLTKEKAEVDHWAKELAPSTELRRWFHSDEGDWREFKKRYRRELDANATAASELKAMIGSRPATLLFGSRDLEHNHAHLLKAYLERKGP